MKFLYSVIVLFSVVSANPTPPPYSSSSDFSVMQTVEFTYHYEQPVGENDNSIILYGGPTAVYVWYPEDEQGEGMGLEAGVEARKYLHAGLEHLFFGTYGGVGILWRKDEENVKALSGGVKIGWKENLHRIQLPFDLEPYVCIGFVVSDEQSTQYVPELVFYLGFKLDIY